MCLTVEKIQPNYFCFDHDQYDKEVALMRKRINKLLNKVESEPLKNIFENQKPISFQEFKESVKNINHEKLK